MKTWPSVETITDDIKTHTKALHQMVRLRNNEDVEDFTNLPKQLIKGRLVGKVPSASNDVVPSDHLGDVNFQEDFGYVLIDDSGTPAWRRWALSAW